MADDVFEDINESETDSAGEKTDASSPPDDARPDAEVNEEGASEEGANQELSDIRKQTSGLKRALMEERNKRQQLEGRLHQITDMIARASQMKKRAVGETTASPEEHKAEDEYEEISVDFRDNDGTPYIKLRKPKPVQPETLLTELEQRIQARLNGHLAQLNAAKAEEQAIMKLLGSNPEYPNRVQVVNQAWKDLNAIYDAFIAENGLETPKTFEDAIAQILETPSLVGQFAKKYPTVDILHLADVFVTPNLTLRMKKMEKLLNSIGPTSTTNAASSTTLSALSKKPSNLSRMSNQAKGAQAGLIDRVASMDIDDFMSLSDADIRAIHKELAGQET